MKSKPENAKQEPSCLLGATQATVAVILGIQFSAVDASGITNVTLPPWFEAERLRLLREKCGYFSPRAKRFLGELLITGIAGCDLEMIEIAARVLDFKDPEGARQKGIRHLLGVYHGNNAFPWGAVCSIRRALQRNGKLSRRTVQRHMRAAWMAA